MPNTKKEALLQARKFKAQFPDRDVRIIKHSDSSKSSGLRYNYQFPAKRGMKNRII
jgi:hypothetical protein